MPGQCAVIGCDEPSDCNAGSCCATPTQADVPVKEFSSITCKPTCDTGDLVICAQDSDCTMPGYCGNSSLAGIKRCFQ
jgi:hypothetical protein